MFALGTYPWNRIGDVCFLTVLCRISGDAEIKDNNRSRTRLSGTGVFLGDVGKKFMERRYSHLRFRRFVVPLR